MTRLSLRVPRGAAPTLGSGRLGVPRGSVTLGAGRGVWPIPGCGRTVRPGGSYLGPAVLGDSRGGCITLGATRGPRSGVPRCGRSAGGAACAGRCVCGTSRGVARLGVSAPLRGTLPVLGICRGLAGAGRAGAARRSCGFGCGSRCWSSALNRAPYSNSSAAASGPIHANENIL